MLKWRKVAVEMKKLHILVYITLILFCCSSIAHAKYQIDLSEWARKVNYNYGEMLRGSFATKDECEKARINMANEASDQMLLKYTKCVGYAEQDFSQTQQDNSYQQEQDKIANVAQANNIRQEKLRKEAKYQEMVKQQKLKELKMQALFDQGKKEMLVQLKSESDSGGLKLKSDKNKLTLKSGSVPADNCDSAKKVELQQAQQRLTELRANVKTMQVALELYKDGLLKNVSNLDQQSSEIEKMSNKILLDGIEYIRGTVTGNFLKSKFKFMSKDKKKKYDDFMKLVEKYQEAKEKKELLSWMVNSPNDTKKLVEGADMLAENAIPGWVDVKMVFRAWSTVGKECVAWLKLNDTNRETEEYSLAIKAIALRMKPAVEEVDHLKRLMAELVVGCI